MVSEAFLQVRAALGAIDNSTVTDANVTGLPNLSTGTYGSVETQKIIDQMIVDAFSRDTEFRQLVTREPLPSGSISFSWLLQEDSGGSAGAAEGSGKAIFYSDGGAGTPVISVRKQAIAVAKALRSDYEVSGLLIAGGFFDVLAAEARDALTNMNLTEEKAFVHGDLATVGVTGSYDGLQDLLLQNSAHGDTSTVYNLTRGTDNCVDVQDQDGGVSGTARGALDLSDMDAILTAVEKRKLGGRRIYLMSFERMDELQQLLQPQQRFMGSIEQPGGFRIPTYRNIPCIRSREMATCGVTNTGSASNNANTDSVIYLLDMDNIVFKNVAGIDQVHVPIMGAGDSTNYLQRADVRGGYYKTYGMLVIKRFDSQGIIWNLTAP